MRFHAEQRPGLGEEAEKEEEGDVKLTELDISHIPVELREYRVLSTGARVTLASAKPLLYMFCAKLPADRQARPPSSLPTLSPKLMCSHALHALQSSYIQRQQFCRQLKEFTRVLTTSHASEGTGGIYA